MDYEPVFRLVAPIKDRPAVQKARGILARAVPSHLEALAVLYDTDKSQRRSHHRYTAHYAYHFRHRRRRVRSVLEIGIGGYTNPTVGGASLRMWRTYFPNAQIYGMDINVKRFPLENRITVLQGDQTDSALLKDLDRRFGPFDLVIDDGSHITSHQIASFEALWPTLRSGAVYAIEDLDPNYWDEWGGGPPGTPGTAVDLAKQLIDNVQIGPEPVASVHAYPQLILIEKASVAQSWVPPLDISASDGSRP